MSGLIAPLDCRPVPEGYMCNMCGGSHWIEDCLNIPSERKPPPEYRCRRCKQGGHWQVACKGLVSAENVVSENGALVVVDATRTSTGPKMGSGSTVYSPENAWQGYLKAQEEELARNKVAASTVEHQRWWKWGAMKGKRVRVDPESKTATHFRDGAMPSSEQRSLNANLQAAETEALVLSRLQTAYDDGVELSPAILNMGLSRITVPHYSAPGYTTLVSVAINSVLKGVAQFNEPELIGVAYSLAKLQAAQSDVYEVFSLEMQARGLDACSTDDMARVLWVLTTSKIYSEGMFTKAAAEAAKRQFARETFSTIVGLLWCFTKSGLFPKTDAVLVKLRIAAAERSISPPPAAKDCVTYLWGLTMTGSLDAEGFAGICKKILASGGACDLAPHDVACFMWAASKFSRTSESDAVMEASKARLTNPPLRETLKTLPAGELVKATVGLVTQEFTDVAKELVDKMVKSLKEPGRNPLLMDLSPGDLCNLAWVLRGFSGEKEVQDMYFAISAECINRDLLSRFSTDQLLALLWAFSKAGISSAKLFTVAKDDIVSRNALTALTIPQLATLLYSYHNLKYYPTDVFYPIRDMIARDLATYQASPSYEILHQAIWAAAAAAEPQQAQ